MWLFSTGPFHPTPIIWKYERFIDDNTTWTFDSFPFMPLSQQQSSSLQLSSSSQFRHHESHPQLHLQQRQQQRHLLIAHYAGYPSSSTDNDSYGTMMDESIQSSRAYCRRWHCDVVSVRGILFNHHPTYNKVALLEMALHSSKYYDYHHLLILDSDAVLVNHSIPITTLLPDDKMLLANRIEPGASDWNINIGVTLWNLRHDQLPRLLWLWKWRCRLRYLTFRSDNDQRPLQFVLQEWPVLRQSILAATKKYFYYDQGQVIKHFMRSNDQAWEDSNSSGESRDRIQKIRQQVLEVCQGNPYC